MAKVDPKMAPPTKVNPAAAPGNKDPKAVKEPKVKRTYHPATLDEEGKPRKRLDAVPADFNPKIHKPLGRKNYKDEGAWLEAKATELEKKAKDLRIEAENSRKLGNVADRANVKRLLAMQKRAQDLAAELLAQGIDVNALLAAAGK